MRSTIKLSQPTRYRGDVREVKGLPVRATTKVGERFVYIHYPQSWEWNVGTASFLPKPKRIMAKPGCNGVTKNGDLPPAIVAVQQKGGVYINPNDQRLGEFEGYVSYYPTENGAKWFVDWCTEATVLSTGQIVWRAQEGEWDRFRAHLVSCGIVEPMRVEIYEKLEDAQSERVDRLLNRLDRNPHLKVKLDKAQQTLEDMRAAWAKMGSTEARVAKPRKAKRASDPLKG